MSDEQSTNKVKWWRLFAFLTLALGLLYVFVDYYAEKAKVEDMEFKAEYTKTGRCDKTDTVLSPQELRVRVIRSLLMAEMEDVIQANNEFDSRIQTFLISRSLTPKDVLDAVRSDSLINLPKEAVYPLATKQDVSNVDAQFLQGQFSMITYDARGDVRIIPSNGIQPISIDGIKKDLYDKKKTWGIDLRGINRDELGKHPPALTLTERALGYGNHYFEVEIYWNIGFDCCGNESHSYIEMLKQLTIKSFRDLRMPSFDYLIVSNCGDVLQREVDDEREVIYFFSPLFILGV